MVKKSLFDGECIRRSNGDAEEHNNEVTKVQSWLERSFLKSIDHPSFDCANNTSEGRVKLRSTGHEKGKPREGKQRGRTPLARKGGEGENSLVFMGGRRLAEAGRKHCQNKPSEHQKAGRLRGAKKKRSY